MCSPTVDVVEGTESGPVFYEVRHERDGRLWTVRSRFSTLFSMTESLRQGKAALPADVQFPPKQSVLETLWQGPCVPMKPEELELRRVGLQTYLVALSQLKESWDSETVTDVLCPPDDALISTASPEPEAPSRIAPGQMSMKRADGSTQADSDRGVTPTTRVESAPSSVPEACSPVAAMDEDAGEMPAVSPSAAADVDASASSPGARKPETGGDVLVEMIQSPSAGWQHTDVDALPMVGRDESVSRGDRRERAGSVVVSVADTADSADAGSEGVRSPSGQGGGEGELSLLREREGASAASQITASSAAEADSCDDVEDPDMTDRGSLATMTTVQRRRRSLLGRARRSLSRKMSADNAKGHPPTLASPTVEAPGFSMSSPEGVDAVATPRTSSRLAAMRDKARNFTGRLSSGARPLSSRSKGKRFRSGPSTGADKADDGTVSEAPELNHGDSASPSPHASPTPGAQMIAMELLSIGQASIAAPPSPGY